MFKTKKKQKNKQTTPPPEIDEYTTENNDFGELNFHTALVCFKPSKFTGMERVGVLIH